MKTMIRMILLATTLLITPLLLNAQNKQLEKALKKEYKTKMKEYQKEGWKIFGTSRSLDVALLLHYQKLNDGDGEVKEVSGIASQFKLKNVGVQSAANNACNKYARQAGSQIKGRIISDLGLNAEDLKSEFDHFYAAYESSVEKEIKGELKESYSIIRETGKGVFEMITYFLVDENAATQARVRAFENAAKESEAAQKYARKVSEFIKEGINVE